MTAFLESVAHWTDEHAEAISGAALLSLAAIAVVGVIVIVVSIALEVT